MDSENAGSAANSPAPPRAVAKVQEGSPLSACASTGCLAQPEHEEEPLQADEIPSLAAQLSQEGVAAALASAHALQLQDISKAVEEMIFTPEGLLFVDNGRVQSLVADHRAQCGELHGAAQARQAHIAALTAQAVICQASVASLDADAEAEDAKLESLLARLEEASEEDARLDSEGARLGHNIAALHGAVEQVAGVNCFNRKDKAQRRDELAAVKARAAAKQEQLAVLHKEVSRIEAEAAAASTAVAGMQIKVDQLDRARTDRLHVAEEVVEMKAIYAPPFNQKRKELHDMMQLVPGYKKQAEGLA